ncbi:hypothetical protein [Holospora curviuscula]|nr:hypothetical protein [Holospora curviuscula]
MYKKHIPLFLGILSTACFAEGQDNPHSYHKHEPNEAFMQAYGISPEQMEQSQKAIAHLGLGLGTEKKAQTKTEGDPKSKSKTSSLDSTKATIDPLSSPPKTIAPKSKLYKNFVQNMKEVSDTKNNTKKP